MIRPARVPLPAVLLPAILWPLAAGPARTAVDAVDAYVASQMTARHIPGLSFAVVRDGAIVRSGARGLANVELNAPATEATEFAIASMSKSVTASAIMLLAQDGRLSIDEPVRQYLPDVPDSWNAMTIRDLLAHTAGVKDHFSDSPIYPKLTTLDRHLVYTTDAYVKAHVDAPLNFAPGTNFSYSGGGYVMLGAIIAKITGHPYGEFLRDRIFRPLRMAHTHVISTTDIIPHRAAGYWFRDGALKNGEPTGPAHSAGADVGVMTTASDLAAWLIAVDSGRLWTPASRDAMWTPATLRDARDTVSFPAGSSYGLGWSVRTYRGYRMVGHGGTFITGFTSTFFMLPEKRFGVIVLTNQYDANPQAIALGIAARSGSDLTPPGEMRVQPDGDTAATARAQAFVSAVFRDGDVAALATPGLARHLSAMWHPPAAPGPPPPLTFIAREAVSRPLQRFGVPVTTFAHYVLRDEGEDHWITFLVTADGRIAGYEAY
jgi:CubicO group peptidase (beta-lactamase class C family)